MKASRASEMTQEQINAALSPSQFPTFHFCCFTDIPEDLGFITSRFSSLNQMPLKPGVLVPPVCQLTYAISWPLQCRAPPSCLKSAWQVVTAVCLSVRPLDWRYRDRCPPNKLWIRDVNGGLSRSHGAVFYIVLICLHLACAAEPVSPFLPGDNENISALFFVIGTGLHCCRPHPTTHHDLIALLCSNKPFRISSPISGHLGRPPVAAGLAWFGYLERPGNPPGRWADSPPSAAQPRDAWDRAGASRICSGSRSEPEDSPNPAADSAAFPPVTATRFIQGGQRSQRVKHRVHIDTLVGGTDEGTQMCVYLFKREDRDKTLILGTAYTQNVVLQQRQ